MITDTIVLVSPMAASNGISFMRLPMDMLTAPPVAWKKEPCGRESSTVAPAWIIAAAARPDTPFASRVGAKVCAATVAPAVVEAVAAQRVASGEAQIMDASHPLAELDTSDNQIVLRHFYTGGAGKWQLIG